MKENYRGMLIKDGKRPVYYLGADLNFKKGYESCFNVFEMGNLVASVNTIEEAKQEIDKVIEKEER